MDIVKYDLKKWHRQEFNSMRAFGIPGGLNFVWGKKKMKSGLTRIQVFFLIPADLLAEFGEYAGGQAPYLVAVVKIVVHLKLPSLVIDRFAPVIFTVYEHGQGGLEMTLDLVAVQ